MKEKKKNRIKYMAMVFALVMSMMMVHAGTKAAAMEGEREIHTEKLDTEESNMDEVNTGELDTEESNAGESDVDEVNTKESNADESDAGEANTEEPDTEVPDKDFIDIEIIDPFTSDITAEDFETGNLQEAGTAFVDGLDDGMSYVTSSGTEENSQQTGATADLLLTAEADSDVIKAGQLLVYTVMVENTGSKNLEQCTLKCELSEENIEGTWEDAAGFSIDTEGYEAVLGTLEVGQKRELYFTIELPEEMSEILTCNIRAVAKFEAESDQDQGESTLEDIRRETVITTEIQPLTVDFTVKKTADRQMAAPGDTIYYQICIRNTGERTLHSVLTTERFALENVHVEFVEKDGVLLNGDKTQALISKIEPGKAFGLQAAVTLPKEMVSQELLNYVTVVTKEPGEKSVEASAAVEVYGNAVTPTPEPTEEPAEEVAEEENAAETKDTAVQASTSPKTGDEAETEFWAGVLGITLLSAVASFWILKAKRKH